MGRQWVVVADRSRARIFQTDGGADRLQEVDDLLNPEGRLDEADLRHDPKGRFYGKGERYQAHTAEPSVSQAAHDEEKFSREVGRLLDQSCDSQRFDSLVMVAPPEFLGQLRKQLSARVAQRITQQFDTGLANWSEQQIRDYLKQHLH